MMDEMNIILTPSHINIKEIREATFTWSYSINPMISEVMIDQFKVEQWSCGQFLLISIGLEFCAEVGELGGGDDVKSVCSQEITDVSNFLTSRLHREFKIVLKQVSLI